MGLEGFLENLLIAEKMRDMSDLEYVKEAERRQQKTIGKGSKIITPKQMIVRLPILLAQKKNWK